MGTHWKTVAKPDAKYFGEADFGLQEGKTFIATIKKHTEEIVKSVPTKQNPEGQALKGILYFQENIKPLILNVTNATTIFKLYGKDADLWAGKKICLYYDPSVKVAGVKIGGTRVKKPPQQNPSQPKCLDCGQEIKEAKGMTPAQVAEYTAKKYGRELCADCAVKAKAKEEEGAVDALEQQQPDE